MDVIPVPFKNRFAEKAKKFPGATRQAESSTYLLNYASSLIRQTLKQELRTEMPGSRSDPTNQIFNRGHCDYATGSNLDFVYHGAHACRQGLP